MERKIEGIPFETMPKELVELMQELERRFPDRQFLAVVAPVSTDLPIDLISNANPEQTQHLLIEAVKANEETLKYIAKGN